jgi:hypothetical protein
MCVQASSELVAREMVIAHFRNEAAKLELDYIVTELPEPESP